MDQSIADVLEQCRQRMERGESIDSCLAAYPSHSAEIAPLLPIIASARSLSSDPDPAFADRSRQRFQRQVTATRARRPASTARSGLPGLLQNLLVPVAVVLVLVLSGFGLVQASQNTLPDSPLYTVKQARESLTGILSRGADARAAFEMKLANRRLLDLQAAEQQKKGPELLRIIAVQMVDASTAATQQVAQSSSQRRATLATDLRGLLAREHRALEHSAKSPNPEVSTTARRLLARIEDDQRRLGP